MKTLKSTVLALFALGSLTVMSYAALLDFREINQSLNNEVSPYSSDELRKIASSEHRYSVLYFPLNNENYGRISGKWHIYNFIDNEDTDHKIDRFVNFELVGNSRIKVASDSDQIFRVSYITDHNTIAIFKKVGDGFEILEAIKISDKNKKLKTSDSNPRHADFSLDDTAHAKGINLEDDVDLILERAFNPNISKNIFVGDLISGSLSLVSGKISGLRVVLAKGLNEEQSIDIEHADIKDGGVFEVENDSETISGIISNFGQGVYRVRFATGPMKGAMLNFVTSEEMNRLLEAKPSTPSSDGRSLEVGDSSVQKPAADYASERKTASQNTPTMESPKADDDIKNDQETNANEIPKEEMEENLTRSGFDFSQNRPKRLVSSITLF